VTPDPLLANLPLLADLKSEHQELDRLVVSECFDGERANDRWRTPTASEGWTVAHQISHLAFFDRRAALSATDPESFAEDRRRLFESAPLDLSIADAELDGADLVVEWRRGRENLVGALAAVDPGRRLDWYGPPMGVRSFATARLMETWAHGQDVVDALGVERQPTARLRHVAHIGVSARAFNLRSNQLADDDAPIRVELIGPDGDLWTWGPEGASDSVGGTALDFCLLVTQRRHRTEVDLRVEGGSARTWIGVAQAFAGPPGAGREPGEWRVRGR